MITHEEKKRIQQKLKEYCQSKGSQRKAATSLTGVSPSLITQLMNDNWDLISDEMWRKIAAQIGYTSYGWTTVETRGYRRMYDLLSEAQENSLVFAATGEAGCGKTEAVKTYAIEHKNAFHVSCSEFWNRKYFMQELLRNMGIEATGGTVSEMMGDVVYNLKRRANPLIILDEADKLSDQVFYFFISLYNQLEDHVGIVLCATNFLEKRIKRGVSLNQKGYNEIFSRIGRRFIPLQVVNGEDIAAVCLANGVSDPKVINQVIEDADCDLRRVKRKIHALKKAAA